MPPPSTQPDPSEILRQVRRIELRTRRLVNSRFSGDYHSIFKGQGIEFAEVREYQPGDDVRSIDWNVTARLGRPYLKRYVEERELTVLLAVDMSGSQRWGTRGRLKSTMIAEVAATLAMSAMHNNDRVGLLIFTDAVEAFVPPAKGRRHALRLVRDLLAFEPERRGTDLGGGLDYATRLLRSRSVIFLFSDFQLGDGSSAFERVLRQAGARHDVVAVHTEDVGDQVLPRAGLLRLTDPESGESIAVDTSKGDTRAKHVRRTELERERVVRIFRSIGVDEIRLRTDLPYASALLSFFRRRERRARR
ncbi:MAG TPA: DUF58 domain-containing protein [Longimicrobiaceae bacterium]|nr:DUF58 domain-containing protein [Longimicrobiaceae bacterium]